MEGENAALPPKRDVARGLLLRGWVYVHLDPRHADVRVPLWLRQQPQLVLQVGLDMPVPIPDLKVDGDGVSGTLSFNRSPFHVVVPWDAVYALVSEDGPMMVWPSSLPPELRAEVEREMGKRPPEGLSLDTPEPPAPELVAREAAAPGGEAAPLPGEPASSGRKLPPYLRVVK
ncbi:MAG: ClpXP protease specificity-enhancing factor SspB [Myxococcota bacterium]